MRATARTNVLPIVLLVYGAASLFHYSHNAEFLAEYPNLPAWLSPGKIYAAWLGVTAVGVAGYLLIRWRHEFIGLAVLALYGLLGLDGLGHYAVAPLSAHSLMMNVTIWLEAATAVFLLIVVVSFMLTLWRLRQRAART